MNEFNKKLIQTFAYFEIFHYPLTQKEVWNYFPQKMSYAQFLTQWKKNFSLLREKNGYFFLSSMKYQIDRIARKKESEKKILRIKKIIPFLFFLPSIQLVGVSGTVAMENAKQDDDIDLFVIVSPHTIWISRLVLLTLFSVFHMRRSYQTKHTKNMICMNMLVDEHNMVFRKDHQDIYTAHEIVGMKVIFQRDMMGYYDFLRGNKWISHFFPNILIPNSYKKVKNSGSRIGIMFLKWMDPFAKALQMRVMNRHKTTEEIRNGFLAFHPFDYRLHILKEYNKTVERYEKV